MQKHYVQWAIERGNTKILQLFFQRNGHEQNQDNLPNLVYPASALSSAATKSDREILSILLNNLHFFDSIYFTYPLWRYYLAAPTDMVQLIEKSFPLEKHKNLLLLYAAIDNEEIAVNKLVDLKAGFIHGKYNALEEALKRNNHQIARRLLDAGALVDGKVLCAAAGCFSTMLETILHRQSFLASELFAAIQTALQAYNLKNCLLLLAAKASVEDELPQKLPLYLEYKPNFLKTILTLINNSRSTKSQLLYNAIVNGLHISILLETTIGHIQRGQAPLSLFLQLIQLLPKEKFQDGLIMGNICHGIEKQIGLTQEQKMSFWHSFFALGFGEFMLIKNKYECSFIKRALIENNLELLQLCMSFIDMPALQQQQGQYKWIYNKLTNMIKSGELHYDSASARKPVQ